VSLARTPKWMGASARSRVDRECPQWVPPVGRAVEYGVPGTNATTLIYDKAGQVIASVDPQSNRTTFVYDAVGNCISRSESEAVRIAE